MLSKSSKKKKRRRHNSPTEMAFHSTAKGMSLLFVAHTVFTQYINIETKLGKEKRIKKHRAVGDMLVVHSNQYTYQWATSNC